MKLLLYVELVESRSYIQVLCTSYYHGAMHIGIVALPCTSYYVQVHKVHRTYIPVHVYLYTCMFDNEQ